MFSDYLYKLITEKIDFGTDFKELLEQGMFPIRPKMMDYLGYSYEHEAYSMINSNEIDTFISFPKTAQISCFTKPDLKLTTLPSNPDTILKVQGRALLEGSSDLYSYLDNSGYRWIKLDYSDKSEAGKILKEKILSIVKKASKKFKKGSLSYYKEYFKELLKFMDKDGYKLLNKHLSFITFKYNEIIMDNIEINEIYGLNKDIKDRIPDKLSSKYKGILSTKEFLSL